MAKYLMTAILLLCLLIAVNCEMDVENTFDEPIDVSSSKVLSVVSMDENHLAMKLSVDLPELEQINADGESFTRLHLGDHAQLGEIGHPAIPYFGLMFAIPQGAEVDVEVQTGSVTRLDGIRLAPMQPPLPDGESFDTPKFAFDEMAYSQNRFLPENPVALENEKIIRGLRVGQAWISPVRYNPQANVVEVASEMMVTLRFTNGQGEFFADNTLRTKAYERMFANFVTNYPVLETYEDQKSQGQGARFIIVTAPEFYNAAVLLKSWKIQMGVETVVVSTEEIGADTASITQYISDAYYNWTMPPEAVLFLGDAEFIPTNYRTLHTAHFSRTGTDLYYVCVDGDDEFADMAFGRISVDTLEQATKRINDIIKYEKDPAGDEDFFTTSHHMAYFQDDNKDRRADRRFAQTSEEIYRWFSEYMPGSNINPYRCYFTDEDIYPAFWNNKGSYKFNPVWWTLSPENIPDDLMRMNGFNWSCGASNIAAAVNAGTFFLTHRDHGSTSGWAEPAFRTTDVLALMNGDQLPVIFSINCQTGWFDNETDAFYNFTGKDKVIFSEAWERNENGGAIGVLAATRTSYSGYNDRLVWGWMDAVWPNYIPDFDGGAKDETVLSMGDVVNYGKLYLALAYGPSIMRKTEFEMFHWFGDPTMKMWTGVPLEFEVIHEEIIRFGTDKILVDVDVAGAELILVMDDEIIYRATTTGAEMTIELESPIEESKTMYVTVVKDGYRPYAGTIQFLPCAINDDCSDGILCNGVEQCVDGYCDGVEPAQCNDGIFCNGEEYCDEELDECVSPGDPCEGDKTCVEASNSCINIDEDDADGCGC